VDLIPIINALRTEHRRLTKAIAVLEAVENEQRQAGGGQQPKRRRGRPRAKENPGAASPGEGVVSLHRRDQTSIET
jgi:hypothetical protein